MSQEAKVTIIGGGLVGLATAWALADLVDPSSIVVLEKEPELGLHQSGRNSGVLHSGIYYLPGSRKAEFCRVGKRMMERFCRREVVPARRTGKLIVAASREETDRLAVLLERGSKNGIPCRRLTAAEVKELEPRVRAIAALEVPDTGVVDFRQVAVRLAERIETLGVRVSRNWPVRSLRESAGQVELGSSQGALRSGYVVNCAGLYSDRLLRSMTGAAPVRIIPFRGEYYRLRSTATEGLSGRCLYPVPDPDLPFLGVHLTPTVGGEWLCGPNAVLALSREGYRWSRLSLRGLWEILTYPGFWRLAARFWRTGLAEVARSLSRQRFASDVSAMVGDVGPKDLEPWPAGVRAQAVSRNGTLVDDFLFHETARSLHVINAPSPAATASLRIGQVVANRVGRRIDR